jgi:DNA polymerase-3 subunit alpha
LLVVDGYVSVDDYTGGFKMSAEKIYNIDQARAAFAMRLVIDVNSGLAENGFVDELKAILEPLSQGRCPVVLNYTSNNAEAEIALGDNWRIVPTGTLLTKLYQLAGEHHVRLIYP